MFCFYRNSFLFRQSWLVYQISVMKEEVLSGENNSAESRRRFGVESTGEASCGRRDVRVESPPTDGHSCVSSLYPPNLLPLRSAPRRTSPPAVLQAIACPGSAGTHHHRTMTRAHAAPSPAISPRRPACICPPARPALAPAGNRSSGGASSAG